MEERKRCVHVKREGKREREREKGVRKGERGKGAGERVLASGRVQVLTCSSVHVLQNRGRERLMQGKECVQRWKREAWTMRQPCSLPRGPPVFKELVSRFFLDRTTVREIAYFKSFWIMNLQFTFYTSSGTRDYEQSGYWDTWNSYTVSNY